MAWAQDIDALTEEAVQRFREDLAQVLARLRAHLATLLQEAAVDEEGRLTEGAANVEIAQGLARDLRRILAELGYDQAIEVALDAFDTGAAPLGDSYSTVTREGLAAFANGVVAELTGHIVQEAAQALHDAMLVGATSQAPRADLVAELASRAQVTLGQAVTELDTSLMAFFREGLVATSEEAGFDLFRYDGPDDRLTRPFCNEHVGRVYTQADLDAEDNGQGLAPTSRYLGGYRCRHSLSPVTVEEARAMVETDGRHVLGGPEARAIVLREQAGPAEAAFVARYAGQVVNGKPVRRRRAA